MGAQRFYEEGEAEEILRRAVRSTDSGAVDRSRLMAMAAELGISEDAIARAEAEMETERSTEAARQHVEESRTAFRKYRRGRFWADFSSYLSVNAFLIGVWWFTGHGYFWPFWVLAGWGIGVLSDFFSAFFGHSEHDYERWRRKQEKRAAEQRT